MASGGQDLSELLMKDSLASMTERSSRAFALLDLGEPEPYAQRPPMRLRPRRCPNTAATRHADGGAILGP
jgi:hypothetical protein